MKGNNGRAARRKTAKRYAMVGSGIVVGVFLLCWMGVLPVPLGGSGKEPSGRLLRDPRGGRHARDEAVGETAHQFRHSYKNQFGDHKDEAQVMKEVLAADLQLVDLTVVEEELLRAPPNSYAGVYGKFCKLDWTLRKKDPSAGAYYMLEM